MGGFGIGRHFAHFIEEGFYFLANSNLKNCRI